MLNDELLEKLKREGMLGSYILNLIEGLNHEKPKHRLDCAYALSRLLHPDMITEFIDVWRKKMIDALCITLKENDDVLVREIFAKILEEFVAALNAKNSDIQLYCLYVIRKVRESGGIVKLEAGLRRRVIEGLVTSLKDPRNIHLIDAFIIVLKEIVESNDITKFEKETKDMIVDGLLLGLKKGNWTSVLSCVEALGQIGGMAIAKELLKSFKNMRYSGLREAYVNAFVKIGKTDERVCEMLIMELGGDDSTFRRDCAKALERINGMGIQFKKIIYNRDENYAIEIGLEATLKIIIKYLELIKDNCDKKEYGETKLKLFGFYREVTGEIKKGKEKMNLDLPVMPANIKSNKGPEFHRMQKAIAR